MKRQSKTIAEKVTFSVFRFGIGVSVIIGVILFLSVYRQSRADVIRSIQNQGSLTVVGIDEAMNLYEQYASILSSDDAFAELISASGTDTSGAQGLKMRAFLNDYLHTISDVYAVGIILPDGRTYQDICGEMNLQNVINSSFYAQYRAAGENRILSPRTDKTCASFSNLGAYFLMIYPYQVGIESSDIVFCVPFDRFAQIVTISGTGVAIFDRWNEPIYSAGLEESWLLAQKAALATGEDIGMEGGVNALFTTRFGGWRVVIHVPEGEIIRRMSSALFTYALFITGLFLLLASVAFRLKRMLGEIGTVIRHMDNISNERDFSVLNVQTGDELETLAKTFNLMMERIRTSNASQMEHERREQRMEYALAMAQANPHFIYKTLNTIIYLCQMNRNADAVIITRALIDLLRDKLRIDRLAIYDTVENELASVHAYLAIQKVYYGDKIRFQERVDKAFYDEQIPKNIVQPLIENAIFHGLLLNETEDGEVIGGEIVLSIERDGSSLTIIVSDSGYGMTEEKRRAVFESPEEQFTERGKHIGIRNIRYRLSHLPGLSYTLNVESTIGVGTTVVLKLRRVADEEE